jgi:hypothetical protein
MKLRLRFWHLIRYPLRIDPWEITRTAWQVISIFSLSDGRRVVFTEHPVLPSLLFQFFGLGFSVFSFVLAAVASKLPSEVKRQGPSFLSCFPGCLSGWGVFVQAMLLISLKQWVPRQRTDHEMLMVQFRLLKNWLQVLDRPTLMIWESFGVIYFWSIPSTKNSSTFASLGGKHLPDFVSVDDVDMCREFLMIIRIKWFLYSSVEIFWHIDQFLSGDYVNNDRFWATAR